MNNLGSADRPLYDWKKALILAATIAVLIFGFFIYKGWGAAVNNEVDKTVILTGSFTCLPAKSSAAPQRGCVLGIKSRDDHYYALDISRIQDANTDLKADDTIAVTGQLRPKSDIAQSDWAGYNIEAIILVNTLLRTR